MRVIVPTTLSNTEGSYSRSGTATIINSLGLYESVAANVVRYAYDITSNTGATLSPDGTSNSSIIMMAAAGGTISKTTDTFTSGSALSVSIHAKKSNSDYVYIIVNDSVSTV